MAVSFLRNGEWVYLKMVSCGGISGHHVTYWHQTYWQLFDNWEVFKIGPWSFRVWQVGKLKKYSVAICALNNIPRNLKDTANFPWRWIFCLSSAPPARCCHIREKVFNQNIRGFTWPEVTLFSSANLICRFLTQCVVRHRVYSLRNLQTIHCGFFSSEFNVSVKPQGIVPWGCFISKVLLALPPLAVSFFSSLL